MNDPHFLSNSKNAFQNDENEDTRLASPFPKKIFSHTEDQETEEEKTRLAPFVQGAFQSDEEITKVSSPLSSKEPSLNSISSEIFERYHILETLGEGGMGIVQRVQDTILGREVALKQIKWGELGQQLSPKQQMMLWRLKAEASITAILEHPNIVPLYDLQRKASGEIYFTMRKIEGETFKSILKKQIESQKQNETILLSIFSKVCDAVSYAHSKGVIHRDLKPDNIMVGAFGEVYVMDWGIAKILSKNREQEQPAFELLHTDQEEMFQELHTVGGIGTPGYMPPEQKSNAAQVTPQSDIYALGKILKQCFTGYSPHEEFQYLLHFYQTQKENTASSKQNKKNNATNILEEKLPPDIKAIIQKATEDSLEKRYQTVQELAQDLVRYQRDIKVSAREYSLLEALQKWVKRNRQKILMALFFITCLIGYPLYAAYHRIKERETRFDQASQNAKSEQEQAQNVTAPGKIGTGQKIESLLKALTYWNSALTLKSENSQVEQQKLKVGKELLYLCYQTQDYQLARYVARELQSLKILTPQQKKDFLKNVEDEQTQVLKKHNEKLDFWEKKFRDGTIEDGEREDAIFEIARMEEEEIIERLAKIVQEGNTYFLEIQNKTTTLNSFYETFATAFGRIEHPKVEEHLLALLSQTAETIVISKKRVPLSLINYMVILTYGLRYSTSPETVLTLTHIYRKMGNPSPFATRTKLIYEKILQNCGKESFILPKQSEEDYLEQGFLKQHQKDFAGAIENYTEAIRLNPYSVRAWLRRGNIKHQLKDFDGAIADFTQAIEMKEDPAVYNNRGDAKRDKGDFLGAIEDYNHALTIVPNSAIIVHNRGMAYYYLNKRSEALQDFTQAIQFDPVYSEPYNARAVLLLDQNKFDLAIQDFNLYIHLRPEFPMAYNNRGMAKFRQGDFKGAIEDFDKTLALNPQYLQSYEFRAKSKRSLGDREGARQDYEQAVQIYQKELEKNPRDVRSFVNVAELLVEMNRIEEAILFLEKSLSLDATYVRGIELLANLLIQQMLQKYRQKDFAEALESIQRFQRSIPKNHPQFQRVEKMEQQLQKQLQEKK